MEFNATTIEAVEKFTKITWRLMRLMGSVSSFKAFSKHGLESIKEEMFLSNVQFINDYFSNEKTSQVFSEEKVSKEEIIRNSPLTMTENMHKEASRIIDAASIVFAHSALDAAAIDYCKVTCLMSPLDWENEISVKMVKLAEVKSMSYNDLVAVKQKQFFAELEKESLIKKINHLFRVCSPPEKWTNMHDYVFDLERVKRLDSLRHEIVHGDGLEQVISRATDDSWFLFKTGLYLMGLVNYKFGLKLNPMSFN